MDVANFMIDMSYNHIYLSKELSSQVPSTAACTPNKHIERTLLSFNKLLLVVIINMTL